MRLKFVLFNIFNHSTTSWRTQSMRAFEKLCLPLLASLALGLGYLGGTVRAQSDQFPPQAGTVSNIPVPDGNAYGTSLRYDSNGNLYAWDGFKVWESSGGTRTFTNIGSAASPNVRHEFGRCGTDHPVAKRPNPVAGQWLRRHAGRRLRRRLLYRAGGGRIGHAGYGQRRARNRRCPGLARGLRHFQFEYQVSCRRRNRLRQCPIDLRYRDRIKPGGRQRHPRSVDFDRLQSHKP